MTESEGNSFEVMARGLRNKKKAEEALKQKGAYYKIITSQPSSPKPVVEDPLARQWNEAAVNSKRTIPLVRKNAAEKIVGALINFVSPRK